VSGREKVVADAWYEVGYHEGAENLLADIRHQFDGAASLDELLGFFRKITGDPDLLWPGMEP
jgi:hypothetical protein